MSKNSSIKNGAVVDAVYDLAINPDRFDQFIETWERYLIEQDVLNHNDPQINQALAQHFQRAFTAMQQAEQSSKTAKASLPQRSVASMCVSLNGDISSCNELAQPIVDSKATVTELFNHDSAADLLEALVTVDVSHKAKPLLATLESGVPCLLLIQPIQGSDELVIDISQMSWNESHRSQLSSLYGLTPRECDIAGLLFQGLSIKEIASQQHRSTETVRKQSKSLLNKTDTHSQAQLMRLLASINLSAAPAPQSLWQHSYLDNKSLTLSDGRTLSYYRSGQPIKGTIIVIHGILHDHELPQEIHKPLVNSGYQIIGVARAWFGDSSPPPDKEHLLSTAANDLKELLDALDIEQATLLSIMAGSIHAFKFCSLFPEKVHSMINVSGVVPIVDLAQLQHLPRGIRAIAKSARYFPKTLPALVLAAVSLLNRGNIQRLFQIGYRNSPSDLAATSDQNIMRRLFKGYRFASQHGYAAYTYEGIEIMRNMAFELKDIDRPVYYINGELDGLTSIDSVYRFCKQRKNTHCKMVPGAGNLLIYVAPEIVTKEVLKILKDT